MIAFTEDTDFDTMFRLRYGGDVKRYHTFPTLQHQTVAAHSWGVAMLMRSLDKNIPIEVIYAALCHDIAEGTVGDMPATAKWAEPELEHMMEVAEDVVNSDLGINYIATMDNYETILLKMCDTLELCFFALEERRLGNMHADKLFNNGYKHLKTHFSGNLGLNVVEEKVIKRGLDWADNLRNSFVFGAGGRMEGK